MIINCIVCAINVSVPAGSNAKKLYYELRSNFSKQLKVICNCNWQFCNCNCN